MEGVGQQRGAEDELDLLAGLADFQLGQHFLRNEVALLDVGPVGREYPQEFLQLGHSAGLGAGVGSGSGLAGVGGQRFGRGRYRRGRTGLITPCSAARQRQRGAGDRRHQRCAEVKTLHNGILDTHK
jgi:hypothetical protein